MIGAIRHLGNLVSLLIAYFISSAHTDFHIALKLKPEQQQRQNYDNELLQKNIIEG